MTKVPVSEFQPHKWQKEILAKFDDKEARFFLLCWHRRARKTTLLLNLLIAECASNPNKVYGYIAPTYKQAKSIIWRDPNMLTRYLPEELIKRKNETELYVEFINGSILAIKGGDDPDSIRGMDFQGIGIDEWALVKREIWEEILRPIIAQDSSRWAIFAFTPKGVNHAHEYWQNALEWKGWHRSMLKSSESNIISETELAQARIEMTNALYEQEMECSFVAQEEKSVITSEMIEALNGVVLSVPYTKRLISGDPSEGGDECVLNFFENEKLIDQKILHENDTMKIVGEIMLFGSKHGTKNYAGDSIGIGKPICDRLNELGWNVTWIQSAESAFDKDSFYNRRTEMWWYVAQRMLAKQLHPIEDQETRRQLVAVKYDVIDSNGKIKLESKKYTKEILGRSPDRGDAYVYGIWGLQFVDTKLGPKRNVYSPSPRYKPMAFQNVGKG